MKARSEMRSFLHFSSLHPSADSFIYDHGGLERCRCVISARGFDIAKQIRDAKYRIISPGLTLFFFFFLSKIDNCAKDRMTPSTAMCVCVCVSVSNEPWRWLPALIGLQSQRQQPEN